MSGYWVKMEPFRVVISYSHKDRGFVEELLVALAAELRRGTISIWYDRELLPGSAFDAEIEEVFQQGEIFLLIISSDFIASDYCFSKELQFAMEKHATKSAVVVPIIARDCVWDLEPLKSLTALPTNALAVESWDGKGARDKAFTDVAKGIRRLVKAISEKKIVPGKLEVNQSHNRLILTEPSVGGCDSTVPRILENISSYFFSRQAEFNELKISQGRVGITPILRVQHRERYTLVVWENYSGAGPLSSLQLAWSVRNFKRLPIADDSIAPISNGLWSHQFGKVAQHANSQSLTESQIPGYIWNLLEDRLN